MGAAGATAGTFRSSDLPRASPGLAPGAVAGGRAVGGAICVGVTTLTTGAGAAATGFNSLRAVSSSGLPGFAASCCCCAAKPTDAAGGAVRATTGRSNTRAGGLSPELAAPRTLLSVGATDGTMATGALASIAGATRTAALPTGCACTKVVVGTAMTAPGTCRLA